MNFQKYFNILQISPTNDTNIIKKAFKSWCLKYNSSDSNITLSKYNEINEAYKILIENIDNISIDNNNYNNNNNNNYNNDNNNNNNNYNDNNNYNNVNNNNNIISKHNNDINHNIDNFFCYKNNIFEETIIISIEITFEQSFCGCSIPVEITRIICKNGIVTNEKENIYVPLPSGIDNNEIIIIENKGNIINNKQYDIKINVILLNHEIFKRNGLDIYYYKNISLLESLTGFAFELEHLNNKKYKINNIKNIIKNNETQVFKNLGFNRYNYIGNLIIKYNIIYPKTISDENKEKLKTILI